MNEILSTIDPTTRRQSVFDSTNDLIENSSVLIHQRERVKTSEIKTRKKLNNQLFTNNFYGQSGVRTVARKSRESSESK